MADAMTNGPQSEANGRDVLGGFRGPGPGVPIGQRAIAFGIYCLAFLWVCRQAVAGGMAVTPLQTQSTSPAGVLVATDLSQGTTGINNPFDFNQFNPKLGTLTAIDITLTTNIRNDYVLTFVPTPIITTIDVATTQTTNPSVLADPAQRALLTDGPTVTLFAPNGVTPLFGPPGTSQPVDLVQLTESSGTFSSMLPITSPNYIEPTIAQQSFSRSLTAADSAALFSDFIGTGMVDLPVTATAFSSFYSSSGNGGGGVITKASATATIQYVYLSASIPEPASVVLLGLGIGISALACRLRRPSACSS